MNPRFQDLSYYATEDGCIRLEQVDSTGESAVIDTHPEQVLYIARRLCGMKPESAEKVAELERRIAVLVDKLQNIICDSTFRHDLIERCGDAFECLAKLDGVLDLALEFDGGRLEPEYRDEANPEANRTSKQASQAPSLASDEKVQQRTITKDGRQLGLPV